MPGFLALLAVIVLAIGAFVSPGVVNGIEFLAFMLAVGSVTLSGIKFLESGVDE